MVAQTYKASKLAFTDIKNDTASILDLNIFKITTFQHLEHRRNMTGYSFYNALDTGVKRNF